MKKIGIVTIYNRDKYYNMGGQLQCFALQSFLYSQGYEGKLISDSCCDNLNLIHFIYYSIKRQLMLFLSRINKSNSCQRVNTFERFRRKYVKHSIIPIYKGINIKQLNKKYDYFIAGSDQVWNPNFFGDMYYQFLAFASSEKKIAYSPSLGVSELTDKQLEMFKKYLKDFPVLSCREKAGAEILKEIVDRDVPVVIDPTLLLTKEEWMEIEHKPKFHKIEKYILLYYLGNITDEYNAAITNFEKSLNCKVIDINDKDSLYYTCGPAEFAYLIHNAEIVLTDSFHACVFSILFEKPFLVFDRCDGLKSMNSRMDNLFDMFDLRGHKYSQFQDLDNILHPDYAHTYELLEVERIKSKNFLLDALKRK